MQGRRGVCSPGLGHGWGTSRPGPETGYLQHTPSFNPIRPDASDAEPVLHLSPALLFVMHDPATFSCLGALQLVGVLRA